MTKLLRLYGVVDDSIVDGVDLRYGVFVQGCPHHCPGCHNKDSQALDGGYLRSTDDVLSDIIASHRRNVTFSGGEPFEQAEALIDLACELKKRDFNLWIYSGYRYEDLVAGHPSSCAPQLLELCDVLVDGPFVESLHSYDLMWKGSSNQRVIDLNKTRERGVITLFEQDDLGFEIPDSW
ncbi:MAG: anaerobic ribonucleoside-triphosphate reductase activating protein [Coriobacteriia bacterium]|nr:anaerobic ribonucleoside-triphosphate reductase activating protein [Coriobacteriia bacterium]